MDYKMLMDEWINIKNQLKLVRGDVKILNTREKDLRLKVQEFMKTSDVTTCTVSDKNAKIQMNTRVVKSPFNKDLVRRALLRYFRGDESLVDHIFILIGEETEVTQKESVTLKEIKK
jgi:hypothetical protein